MNRKEGYKSENQRTNPSRDPWADPGFEILLSPVDSSLFEEISEYMKGHFDTEEVKNDPAYSVTDGAVKNMISGYRKNIGHNKDIDRFIRESLAEQVWEEELRNEISKIKQEISLSNLNDITSEWVEEWHKRQQVKANRDPEIEEIRDFIAGSFENEDTKTEVRSNHIKKSASGKSLITRYISLAAATIIGAVFIVRMLMPSDDTQKIFGKYYEQFPAISSVTRSTGTSGSESFARAIGNYKSGDYQSAAAGFSEAILDGSESTSAGFFLGITEIELKNYNKAIILLEGVAKQQGEYTKDAIWYLGLVYCKTGNEVKASECFELLARSQGFYSDRSEKILRRLK